MLTEILSFIATIGFITAISGSIILIFKIIEKYDK